MKHEVNGIVVMTDDVTEAGLRREHASIDGEGAFLNFLEFLVEGLLDAYDDQISDKSIKSIKLFDYEDLYFGITFDFEDGWSYTVNRDQSWELY